MAKMEHLTARCVAVCCAFATFIILAAPAQASPSNDNFADAQVIGPSLPIDVAASNVGATAEPGEEPHFSVNPPSKSVWFRWTAPVSGTVVVETCPRSNGLTSTDTLNAGIYTGVSLDALISVYSTAGVDCLFRFNSVSGTDYRIAVDFPFDEGDFRLKIRLLAPPDNDDFADARELSSNLPLVSSETTLDATWEAGEPAAHGDPTRARSVWFRWAPVAGGPVQVDVCDRTQIAGALNPYIGIYTGSELDSLTTTASSTECKMTFVAAASTTYLIAVSGPFTGEFNFVFKLRDANPPVNDNFAQPQSIGPGLPIEVIGDNELATVETGEPTHGGSGTSAKSVWYKWTPSTAVTVRINACSPYYSDGRIGVYTGDTLASLEPAVAPPGYSPYCVANLEAEPGVTYRIAVGGGSAANSSGPFSLRIRELTVPANDDFAEAQILTGYPPIEVKGTNFGASGEPGEPVHADGLNDPTASVWYRWTAPADAQYVFSTCGSEFHTTIAAYVGSQIGSLLPVGGVPTYCEGALGGRLTVDAVIGQVFRIAVEVLDPGEDGAFTLRISGPSAPAPPSPGLDPPVIPPPGITNPPKSSGGPAGKSCRKIKRRVRRARCLKQAQLRSGRLKCRKIRQSKKRARCLRTVKRRAGIAFCRNAKPKRAKRARSRCIRRVKRATRPARR